MRIPYFGKIEGEGDERAQKCEELYRLADQLRQAQEREWYNNALFLAGKHWERAYDDLRRWNNRKPVYAPNTKVQLTDNQILPLHRQAAAALRDNMPRQLATPATMERQDIEAAEIGTDFIESRFVADKEETRRFFDIQWVMVTGQVMRKVIWAPEAEYLNRAGELVPGGEISTYTLSPFKYHLCPWVDASEPLEWLIESDVRDIDEINDFYPGFDVQAEEVGQAVRMIDSLLSSVIEQKQPTGSPKRKEVAILKRLYHAPTRKQPKGKVFIWAAGKLLDETELPEGKMPWVAINWMPVPGRVYPLPFITPLVDLQKEINFTMSQLVELRNRQLRGDVGTTGVGGVNQEKVRDDEGNITGQKQIKFDPGITHFEFLKYDLRTTEAEALLLRLHNDMMQVAGIHESSLGAKAPRATTATEVAMLKESDLAGLTIFRTGLGLAYCDVSQLLLLNAKNHYKTERMIRVVGTAGNVEKVSSFYGSDLRSTQDVRPRSTPILTQTMIAQMEAEAAALGLYGPYAGPKDKLSKLDALARMPIPNALEEAEKRAAPMTIDELRQLVGEIEKLEANATVLGLQAQIDDIVLKKQIQEMSAQNMISPPPPPGGAPTGDPTVGRMPVRMDVGPPEAMMGGQGAPMPGAGPGAPVDAGVGQ